MPTPIRLHPLTRAIGAALLATLLALPLLVGVSAPADAAPKAYTVTVKASSLSLVLGQASKLTGTVSPKAAGDHVLVQERRRQKWKTFQAAKISASSTYTSTYRPTNAARHVLRVCVPPKGKRAAGCSPTFVVTVSRWQYLYEMDSVDYSDVYRTDPLMINGRSYKKSFITNTYRTSTSFIEFNLSRRCSQLKMSLGVTDSSRTGATAQFEALADGNQLLTRTYELGQSENVVLDVRNVLRVRLEGTSTAEGGRIGIGSPQVLCSQ